MVKSVLLFRVRDPGCRNLYPLDRPSMVACHCEEGPHPGTNVQEAARTGIAEGAIEATLP